MQRGDLRVRADSSRSLALLPALMLIALVGALLWQRSALDSASKWEERADATILLRHRLHDALATQAMSVSSYLLTGAATSRKQLKAARTNSAKLLHELQASLASEGVPQTSAWSYVGRDYAFWLHDTKNLVAGVRPGSLTARLALWRLADLHMHAVMVALRPLANVEQQRRNALIDQANFLAKLSLGLVLLGGALGLTLVFVDFRRSRLLGESRAQEERARAHLAQEQEHLLLSEVDRQRAEESNRLKSQFVASMSHELRTPLIAILGFTELLLDGMAGPLSDLQRRHVASMARSGRGLLNLINDLLDSAQIESGSFRLRIERLAPSALTREVLDVMAPLTAKKNLHVGLHVADAPAVAWLDAARFEQVLYNLFSNAVKFTPYGGSVDVSVTGDGATGMRLDVKDSGVGIAQRDYERLFIPFSQLDTRPADELPGTGLGLSLCKQIIEAHGGSIQVVSQAGQGSVFSVTLPDCVGPSAPAPGRMTATETCVS